VTREPNADDSCDSHKTAQEESLDDAAIGLFWRRIGIKPNLGYSGQAGQKANASPYSVPLHGGTPLDFKARETLKSEAWSVIGGDASNIDKAWALLYVIEAHYWRAKQILEALPVVKQRRVHGKRYSKGYELDIDVYTRHWLWSNKDADALKNKSCNLVELLKEFFGYEPEQSKFLPVGHTIYDI
jgi:hypothetical protein